MIRAHATMPAGCTSRFNLISKGKKLTCRRKFSMKKGHFPLCKMQYKCSEKKSFKGKCSIKITKDLKANVPIQNKHL